TGPLDLAALRRALNAVVARHEPLRTAFPAEDGRAALHVRPSLELELPLIDLAGLPEPARTAEARRRAAAEAHAPFDLAAGPLIRATALRLAADRHWVLFTVHHIVFDGWSEGVLVEDLMKAYAGETLGPVTVSYGDYAAWQHARKQDGTWSRQAE